MTEALLVRLSMLLDGALPDAEAEALRARIASEPEVAAAWATLQELPASLASLPTALPPPPALDAALLDRARSTAPPRRHRWWPAAAAAAAASVLWLSWPAPAPAPATIELLAGHQHVSGEATVLAAQIPVTVSGRADISVEPQGGWTREPEQEEEGMVRMLFSMGAGVLVTVAVYEGAAIVSPPGEAPVTVSAGEQHSVPASGEQPALLRDRQARRPKVEAGGAVSAELSAYIDDLEAEVAALRLERDMQQGALLAVEGEQQSWPDAVDPSFQPEAFSASMTALAESHPDLELVGVDCDEYPCLAMFQSYSDGEDWARGVGEQIEGEWNSEEDPADLSLWASVSERDGERVQLLGVGVFPEGTEEGVQHRSEWRMDGWIKEAAEESLGDPAP